MKKLKILMVLLLTVSMVSFFPFHGSANSAKSAVLIEQESGRILYEKNAYTPMRIASITKIMTAILAIESGTLNEYTTISEKAANTEGSSIHLMPKQKVKMEDLVYGLMLRSGNDAAVAIAEHVSGSLDQFVLLMNKKAKEIGMKQTVFANPHGLDDHEEHYSSAYDMALLTQYAMKNTTYQKVSSTKRYRYKSPDGETRVWKNKNKLLTKLYPYSTGGKTGYTIRAKRTLVSTAEKGKMKLIAVTINDPNDWKDHINMFENAFRRYQLVEVIDKKEFHNTPLYLMAELGPKQSLRVPVTASEKKDIMVSVIIYPKNKHRDIKKPIGKIKVYLKDHTITESGLYLKSPQVHKTR